MFPPKHNWSQPPWLPCQWLCLWRWSSFRVHCAGLPGEWANSEVLELQVASCNAAVLIGVLGAWPATVTSPQSAKNRLARSSTCGKTCSEFKWKKKPPLFRPCLFCPRSELVCHANGGGIARKHNANSSLSVCLSMQAGCPWGRNGDCPNLLVEARRSQDSALDEFRCFGRVVVEVTRSSRLYGGVANGKVEKKKKRSVVEAPLTMACGNNGR